MHDQYSKRLQTTSAWVFALGIIQICALTALGLSAKAFILSPAAQAPMVPEIVYAQIIGNELAIPTIRYPAEDRMILRFVNLKTGIVRTSQMLKTVPMPGMISNGEVMWVLGTDGAIYETDGSTSATFRPTHLLSTPIQKLRRPFLYDGQPAVIDRSPGDIPRLLVLVDHDWQDYGRVDFPGVGRNWINDPVNDTWFALADSPAEPLDKDHSWWTADVSEEEGRLHSFQIDRAPDRTEKKPLNRIFYRQGLKPASAFEIRETASALTPENAPVATSNWTMLSTRWPSSYLSLSHHRGDLYLTSSDSIWRMKNQNGRFSSESMTCIKNVGPSALGPVLVPSPTTGELFALFHTRLGEIHTCRIDGDQVEELPFLIDGLATPMVREAALIAQKGLTILWLGTLLFLCVAIWLIHCRGPAVYSFGYETRQLAPISRRAFARCFDLTLVMAPLVAEFIRQTSTMDSQQLFAWLVWQEHSYTRFDQLLPTMAWAVICWTLIVASSGRWGLSPGKWLMGIRVVRSTLRRVGFSRALMRELLLCIDTPMFLTGFPAITSLLMTENQQRLGDLAADSIVIEARDT